MKRLNKIIAVVSFSLMIVFTGFIIANGKNISQVDKCEDLIRTYLDIYVNENIPQDTSDYKAINSKYIDDFTTSGNPSNNKEILYFKQKEETVKAGSETIKISSRMEGETLGAESLFRSKEYDNIIFMRHDAIQGKYSLNNADKKEKLFKLQDQFYRNLKFKITTNETDYKEEYPNGVYGEIDVNVSFKRVDNEAAQKMFDDYVIKRAEKELPDIYKNGMTVTQIDEAVNVKSKEIIQKLASSRDWKLHWNSNNFKDAYQNIIDDAVLNVYENLPIASEEVTYNFKFLKVHGKLIDIKKKKGDTNTEIIDMIYIYANSIIKKEDQGNVSVEIVEPHRQLKFKCYPLYWYEIDSLIWHGNVEKTSDLLPIKLPDSYFNSKQN